MTVLHLAFVHLDEDELAGWRAGRNAVHELAALTIGARLAVVCVGA